MHNLLQKMKNWTKACPKSPYNALAACEAVLAPALQTHAGTVEAPTTLMKAAAQQHNYSIMIAFIGYKL